MTDYAEAGRLLLGNLNIQDNSSGGSRMKRQISDNTSMENDNFEPKLQRVQFLGARKAGVVPLMWSQEEDEALKNAIEKYGEKKWRQVAEEVPGRNHLQCLQRWRKSLKPGLAKGHWSKEEDRILLDLIGEFTSTGRVSSINWASVASQIKGRNPKQCRERWFLNLDPAINRGPWTPEEDQRLIELAQQCGGRWSLISKNMPGRTENSVKTRYQSLQRQQARNKPFTPDEDQIILDATLQLGRDWAKVVKHLPGRSRGQLKKRFVVLTQHRPDIVRQIQLVEEALAQGQPPPYNPNLSQSLQPQQPQQYDEMSGWMDMGAAQNHGEPRKKNLAKKYGSSWMAGIVDNLEPPPNQGSSRGLQRTNSTKVIDSVINTRQDEGLYPPPMMSSRTMPRHDTNNIATLDKFLASSESNLGNTPNDGLEVPSMQEFGRPTKGLKQTYSSWGSIGGEAPNFANIFSGIGDNNPPPPPQLGRQGSSMRGLQKMSSINNDQWTKPLGTYESTADFNSFLQML